MVKRNVGRHCVVASVSGVLLLTLGACRSLTPIYQVERAPLQASADATLDDASEAIWRAGRKLGWEIEEESPGVQNGTLRLRGHVAVVRIEHDTKVFSIHDVKTENLRRNGDRIHPNYNGWIRFLEDKIEAEPVTHVAN